MAIQFRADNIGSLLRPPELLQARMALRDGRMNEVEVREIEDRSILKALADAAGRRRVEIFTDGEYRRDIFTADITKAMWAGAWQPCSQVRMARRGKELGGRIEGRQSPIYRRRQAD